MGGLKSRILTHGGLINPPRQSIKNRYMMTTLIECSPIFTMAKVPGVRSVARVAVSFVARRQASPRRAMGFAAIFDGLRHSSR